MNEKQQSEEMTLREVAAAPYSAEESMIRTQVYLTRSEHAFLQAEASRRNQPMAAVLRSFIDEKMRIPDEAWANNPMLAPTPSDPDYEGREDASVNHDHYVYGGPKKYGKARGR
jgi:hypothetical protein